MPRLKDHIHPGLHYILLIWLVGWSHISLTWAQNDEPDGSDETWVRNPPISTSDASDDVPDKDPPLPPVPVAPPGASPAMAPPPPAVAPPAPVAPPGPVAPPAAPPAPVAPPLPPPAPMNHSTESGTGTDSGAGAGSSSIDGSDNTELGGAGSNNDEEDGDQTTTTAIPTSTSTSTSTSTTTTAPEEPSFSKKLNKEVLTKNKVWKGQYIIRRIQVVEPDDETHNVASGQGESETEASEGSETEASDSNIPGGETDDDPPSRSRRDVPVHRRVETGINLKPLQIVEEKLVHCELDIESVNDDAELKASFKTLDLGGAGDVLHLLRGSILNDGHVKLWSEEEEEEEYVEKKGDKPCINMDGEIYRNTRLKTWMYKGNLTVTGENDLEVFELLPALPDGDVASDSFPDHMLNGDEEEVKTGNMKWAGWLAAIILFFFALGVGIGLWFR